MKIKLNIKNFNEGLEKLRQDYLIFAPKSFNKRGTYSDTDVIRYDEVYNYEEMIFNKKSDFSAKETFLPINQILFSFNEDKFEEPSISQKKILIFLRACDLNAIKRIDQIFLYNGPEDNYYKRLRERTKFILVGCSESFRNCFCVSMNTNIATEYDAALNIRRLL